MARVDDVGAVNQAQRLTNVMVCDQHSDAPLGQVAADLRRWYGIDLTVDSVLSTRTVNATFDRGGADAPQSQIPSRPGPALSGQREPHDAGSDNAIPRHYPPRRGAGMVNKNKYKEVQEEIQDVSRSLRESTNNLVRNLKENPNVSGMTSIFSDLL